jgi:hypothetical protein
VLCEGLRSRRHCAWRVRRTVPAPRCSARLRSSSRYGWCAAPSATSSCRSCPITPSTSAAVAAPRSRVGASPIFFHLQSLPPLLLCCSYWASFSSSCTNSTCIFVELDQQVNFTLIISSSATMWHCSRQNTWLIFEMIPWGLLLLGWLLLRRFPGMPI